MSARIMLLLREDMLIWCIFSKNVEYFGILIYNYHYKSINTTQKQMYIDKEQKTHTLGEI